MSAKALRVVLLKPSKYLPSGWVERFHKGFVPNGTVLHIQSMTPAEIDGVPVEVVPIDEYVHTDLDYLRFLRADPERTTLLALVGVQSNQFHRALDLGAYAMEHGVKHVVMGGPHPMTCDTSAAHGRGVSISLTEAEAVWTTILRDAIRGEMLPVYGGRRWVQELVSSPALVMPGRGYLRRYAIPMIGVYPSRGCPFDCSFCSVVKVAGRAVRSQPIETTVETFRRAKAAGVRPILFASDNFNKIPDVDVMLEALMEADAVVPWGAQVDTQLVDEPDLIELMARAGCVGVFIGGESFGKASLEVVEKNHNKPQKYAELLRLLRKNGIMSIFASILGFPDDTPETVAEHARQLRLIDPDMALFFILTPLPGTRMWDDFMERGLVVEQNLDLYDAYNLTWRHPTLSHEQLLDLVQWGYRAFHGTTDIVRRMRSRMEAIAWSDPKRAVYQFMLPLLFQTFSYVNGLAKTPTSYTGFVRREIDRVDDYIALRRKRYGFDLAPLPRSLELGEEDRLLNRSAKLDLKRKTLQVVRQAEARANPGR